MKFELPRWAFWKPEDWKGRYENCCDVMRTIPVFVILILYSFNATAADNEKPLPSIDQFNVIWTSQSKNSSESMPVGGGDIGLNVWVENNELLFYISRAGCRDENGALLKLGRCRIKLTPDPFENSNFLQELKLPEGYVHISSKQANGTTFAMKVWVEVFRPIVHVDIESGDQVSVEATYESWRTETIELPDDDSKHDRRAMCMLNYDAYPGEVYVYKDKIEPQKKLVRFYHQVDNSKDVFDFIMKQQGLEPIRTQMVNPLENLVWGGLMQGINFVSAGETRGKYAGCPYRGWRYVSKKPANSHQVRLYLHTDQTENISVWKNGLQNLITSASKDGKTEWEKNLQWWSAYWSRSYMVINSGSGEGDEGWRIGRNYQLFRYMLASNLNGIEPTIFNGGLFTFDALYVNGKEGPGYTPDHRQWGAAFTGQNQRMMYWPMLKSGDFDLMPPGFSFYLNNLSNAKARTRHYWNHDGCAFVEQSTIGSLPGACQYGFAEGGRRGRGIDNNVHYGHGGKEIEVDVQLQTAGARIFESQLEWSWMMIQYYRFTGNDISQNLPFIKQSVIFYDEHCRYRCKQLTGKELDANGKLLIYPSNTLEAHWEARNPTSVIAGLSRVLNELINLPGKYTSPDEQKRWQDLLDRLPDMPIGHNSKLGGSYFKPAENWESQSWHCPEMYPLFPYQIYGVGFPDLDLMKRTSLATGNYRYHTISWEQANIHAARLGDTELARRLNVEKMDNGPYRFPAFWPPDIDWVPDHNWGGSGMIGMQEMLMQTHTSFEEVSNGEYGKIRLLPAWPIEWNVDFKLHAPGQTTVEGRLKQGKFTDITIIPESRRKDLIIYDDENDK